MGARRGAPQADALEQLAGPRVAAGAGLAREAELDGHKLARGQLSGERPPVVLVGVADRVRVEAAGLPRAERRDVDAGDADRPRRGLVEAGDDPQQSRLPRAARPGTTQSSPRCTVRVRPCSAATPPSEEG